MRASVLIVISELVWFLSSPEAGYFHLNPFRLRGVGCALASLMHLEIANGKILQMAWT